MSQNLIQNGDFSANNGGADRDPLNWTVTESSAGNIYVIDTGRVAFNRGNTVPGASIQQTVTGVPVGKDVTFSFDYFENGISTTSNASIRADIIDGNGNVVHSINVTSASSPSYVFTATTSSYTIRFVDTTTGTGVAIDPQIDNVSFDIPCFVAGTVIATEAGPVLVDDLRPGMAIQTQDGGFQEIRWIACETVALDDMDQPPGNRPINIPAGALGDGTPATDLMVSPQHRMLVSSSIAERMFGSEEVLVAAKKLVGIEGICVAEEIEAVTYYHLLLDAHEIVFANGARAESLLLGPITVSTLGPEAQAELEARFPNLVQGAVDAKTRSVRPIIEGRRLSRMLARHRKNSVPLVTARPQKQTPALKRRV